MQCVIAIVMKGAGDLPSFPPEAIPEAILVFGVLRAPNVIPCEDPMYNEGAVLVDFN